VHSFFFVFHLLAIAIMQKVVKYGRHGAWHSMTINKIQSTTTSAAEKKLPKKIVPVSVFSGRALSNLHVSWNQEHTAFSVPPNKTNQRVCQSRNK